MTRLRKILSLLSRRERRLLVLVLFAVILLAAMETAGVGAIFPFLSVVANPSLIETNAQLRWVYETFSFTSQRQFISFLGIGVIVFLVARNLAQLLTNYALVHYSHMRQYTVGRRLLSVYVNRPYSYFLNKNSSELARNILAETTEAINGFLAPILQLVSRIVIAVFLLTLLVVIEPLAAVVSALAIVIFYGGVYYLVRIRLAEAGKGRLEENRRRYKSVLEVFGGIKDIKLLGKERVFVQQFSDSSRRIAKHNTFRRVMPTVPRYVLETIVFGGLLGYVLYVLSTGQRVAEIVPVIGVYGLAAYRLTPAVQQLFTQVAAIRSSRFVVDMLYEEFTGHSVSDTSIPKKRDIPRHPFTRDISFDRVQFVYPESQAVVLSVDHLSIGRNTTVGFVGATGSGKTTAVDLLLGLLRPTSGQIRVDGTPLESPHIPAWQRNLGYVPQHIYLSDDTITNNIAFGIHPEEVDQDRVLEAARIAHLDSFVRNELPERYQTVVGERGIRLSGGQRQRIGIARALYHDPEVLVMDEATSALDTVTEEAVMTAIEDLMGTKTVVLIAHRISTVRRCDVIFVLDGGRVVDRGSYDELISRSAIFRSLAAGQS